MKNRRSPRGRESLRRAGRSAVGAVAVILVAGALGYEGMWAIRFATSHPYFTLTEISVQGNCRLERAEVLRLAEVRTGASIWDASPDAIRANLLRSPWIRDAEVRREFPTGLTISIGERRPAAIVQFEELHYVDPHGQVLGIVGADDSRDFPLITGLASPGARKFAEAGIRRALRLIRLCGRHESLGVLSEVAMDPSYGATIFPQKPTVGVHMGWGGWSRKLGKLVWLLSSWDGRTEQVRAIDLSFRDRAVVKLKEIPAPVKTKVESHRKGTRI